MNRLTQKKVLSMFTPLTMWQQKQRTTSQLSFGRIIGRIVVMMMVLVLIQISTASIQAQNQPVFRIGVLGEEDSDFVHGIQLAVDTINADGGVIGADGTAFQLELVIQPTETMTTSLANINQASVIAVLGPERSNDVLSNLSSLQALNVPILTPATDDSIIALDNSNRIFRVRAQEVLLGRSLADYLLNQLNFSRIATAQLDIESTGGVFGFANALQAAGVAPTGTFILDNPNDITNFVTTISNANPEALATYGPEELASALYLQLRASGWQGQFIYNRAQSDSFKDNLTSDDLNGILASTTWSASTLDETSTRFTLAYVRQVGQVPESLSAAGRDAISLLAEAIGQAGDLTTNLGAIRDFQGVQGVLSPASLTPGEMSNNTLIQRLNGYGGAEVVARYVGNVRIDADDNPLSILPTPTPAPTATPDGVTLTITRAVQNVRTGPGLNYDIIGQLSEGEQARIIGANVDNSWVVINFRGQNAWLSRGILDVFGDLNTVPIIAPPPTPTPPPATATPTAEPFADIIIVSASPTRITLGQAFNVSVVVRNQGSLAAGNFAVAASFEPGGVYSAVNIPSLAANTEITVTLTGTLSGSTGLQSVVVVADLNNQVNEGTAGENNNGSYIYNYVADDAVMAGGSGTIFINNGFGTSLDGGATDDINWSGGVLSGVGSTQFVVMTGFADLARVHRDAIPAPNTVSVSGAQIQPGAIIGFVTDGGNKTGVLQVVTSPSGGQLQFNVRVYN
jgi:branched-chain amino acid transport system substrate-binding protein